MMAAKSGSNGNRILLISFVTTFLVLSTAAALIIYIPKLQTIQHIPTSYEVKTPDWIRFVPPGPEKVTMMNFTGIYQAIGNYSVFTSENLLEVLDFSTKVTIRNSAFAVSVYYQNPNPNSEELVLNILKMDHLTYSSLQGELETMSSEKVAYGGVAIYQVTRSTSNSTAYVIGYVCLSDGYLIYSDSAKGLDLIKSALDNEAGNMRLIDDPKVKAAFYVLTPGSELAFSYSTFPYVVSDVLATSTTVSYEGNSIITRSLYAFNTTSTAEKDLDKIKQANLNASDFQVIDNYILVIAKYDKANLLSELRSL
jgi:hypothetical protein